jgi:hypothetical protein
MSPRGTGEVAAPTVESSGFTGVIIGVIACVIIALILALVFMRRRCCDEAVLVIPPPPPPPKDKPPPTGDGIELPSINVDINKRAPPTYWQLSLARTARANDGFALIALDSRTDANLWATLQSLLQTDPTQLSKGKDVRQPGVYSRLELACAWRLEHPNLWDCYVSGQQQIQEQLARLRKNGTALSSLGLKTDRAHFPGGMNAEANERVLMHGTKPDKLLSILSNGPNEHFSGGIFGHGTYFAEDVGKNDQYVTTDVAHDTSGARKELHERLFVKVRHPGRLHYLLVCRVSLGHSVRTQDGQTSMDGGGSIFATGDKRELAVVPRASPPVHFHSLVAEIGPCIARFREFIVFHGSYIYPEYLVAYQRMGGNGAV